MGCRANQVEDIEGHIVELGGIFQRLSTLIAEQGEQVERIDDNMDNALVNVEARAPPLRRSGGCVCPVAAAFERQW